MIPAQGRRPIELAIAGALIGVGAWLRLRGLGEMEFKGDEQRALQLGIDLALHPPWLTGEWPTHGMPSSANIGNGPLFTWLLAAISRVADDPVAVTRVIALINVACLYPIWRWLRRHADTGAALMALAILAVSPFTVMFSRKIWTQNLLIVGVVLTLWSIEWLRSGRRWRGVLLLLLAVVFLGQLHQSGPLALAALGVAFVLQQMRDRRSEAPSGWNAPRWTILVLIAAAAALVLLMWVPYLSYLWTVPAKTLQERPMLPSMTLDMPWAIANQVRPVDVLYFFRPNRDDFLADPVRRESLRLAVWLGGPLAIYGVYRWLRWPGRLPVIGLWWLLVTVIFIVARVPILPFYVLIVMPLPVLLAAGVFDSTLPRGVAAALRGARVFYVAALLVLTITMQNWLFVRGGATVGVGGAYGVAYSIRVRQAQAIAAYLRDSSTVVPVPEDVVCEPVTGEVSWLVSRVDPGAGAMLAGRRLQICEAFVGPEGSARHRWGLQEAELPR